MASLKGLGVLLYTLWYRGRQVLLYFGRPDTWRMFRAAGRFHEQPTLHVAGRALELYLRERLPPDDAVERGLTASRAAVKRYRDHLPDVVLHPLQAKINSPHAAPCRDKLMFHSHCRLHVLPVPKLYLVLSPHGGRTTEREPRLLSRHEEVVEHVERHLPNTFVIKPRDGNKGRDVHVIGAQSSNVDRHSLSDLLGSLAATSDDYLVEERLVAHSDIQQLTGVDTVCSARLFTLIENGEVRLLDGYLRLVVGGALTDNISATGETTRSGNILATLDVRNGLVSEAFRFSRFSEPFSRCASHPDTGACIEGFRIPCWRECAELVHRAAMCFAPLMTIGWDVALTPNGPVLIEANERYQHGGLGAGARWTRQQLERAAAQTVAPPAEAGEVTR